MSCETVNGVSKQLTVAIQNGNLEAPVTLGHPLAANLSRRVRSAYFEALGAWPSAGPEREQ